MKNRKVVTMLATGIILYQAFLPTMLVQANEDTGIQNVDPELQQKFEENSLSDPVTDILNDNQVTTPVENDGAPAENSDGAAAEGEGDTSEPGDVTTPPVDPATDPNLTTDPVVGDPAGGEGAGTETGAEQPQPDGDQLTGVQKRGRSLPAGDDGLLKGDFETGGSWTFDPGSKRMTVTGLTIGIKLAKDSWPIEVERTAVEELIFLDVTFQYAGYFELYDCTNLKKINF